jgi:nucleoid-associated protein YgaU
VDVYWTTLISANRTRLAHGDDPDLVFPGQIFELPAPPLRGQP